MAQRPIKLPIVPDLPPTLRTVSIDPASLVRISAYNTGEPHFGKRNRNRFDDPNRRITARFGTCYLGTSLAVAIAESVLHDILPDNGWFVVPKDVLAAHFVVRFTGQPLRLADLTGAALKRLGGHAELTGTASYTKTKKWSVAVHAHPAAVDGFVYMSRHKNDEKAVVLFDRARDKLTMLSATPLLEHRDFGAAGTDLCIRTRKVTARAPR